MSVEAKHGYEISKLEEKIKELESSFKLSIEHMEAQARESEKKDRALDIAINGIELIMHISKNKFLTDECNKGLEKIKELIKKE